MITALLLAAGRSRRYGADKLLQPLADGRPVIAHCLAAFESVVDEVLVVSRPDNPPLIQLLDELGVRYSLCPDADAGMGHSLAWGANAAAKGADLLVGLADLPFISSETVARVTELLVAHDGIVIPCFKGQRGHPVGFSAGLRGELSGLTADQGAKSVIQRHEETVRVFESGDSGVVLDIDTPDQLQDALERKRL